MKIVGQKIVLRDLQFQDLQAYAHWLRPGHEWQKLDAPYFKDSLSPDQIPGIISGLTEKIRKHIWPDPRKVLVIADRYNDEFLGRVSWYWESEETNWPALGIVIYDPAHWRRGFGYEALGLWSDYLFREGMDFARLDLRTWSGNHGMMRLAHKVGYVQEACFRDARIVNGEFYDSMGYGVLRREWEEKYPNGFAAHLTGR